MLDNIGKTVDEIIAKVEELLKEGNLKRIIIKDKNGELFIEIPIIIGAILTVAAPFVTAIGVIAGYAAKFTVEIVKKDDSKILMLCENNKEEE